MIVAHQQKSNLAAGICLASFLCILLLGMPDIESSPAFAVSVAAVAAPVAAVAYFFGLWFYIKAKGRSGWWSLFLLLHIVGLVVIACLKDRAREPLESSAPSKRLPIGGESEGDLHPGHDGPTFQSPPRLHWPAVLVEH